MFEFFKIQQKPESLWPDQKSLCRSDRGAAHDQPRDSPGTRMNHDVASHLESLREVEFMVVASHLSVATRGDVDVKGSG